jgi:hypothetical protein
LQDVSKRKFVRRDSTSGEEAPDLGDFLLRQIVMGVPEQDRMSPELHADAIAGLVVDLGAERLQEMHNLLEIDCLPSRRWIVAAHCWGSISTSSIE